MKRVTVATIAIGLAACSVGKGRMPGQSPSADEIVARNVAARGGLDAWRKVQTMVWMGHVESARAPAPSMPFALEQKRPNKTRLQIDAVGQRAVRVFDGARGWKVLPGQGQPSVQPYTAPELKSAQAGHGIDGPLLDHAAKGNAVTLESLDELGGRRAYHLKVSLAKGGDEDVWVDTETWLEVRYDRMAEASSGGLRRVSVTYADYRDVDGLKLPFLIETGGGSGATPDRMRIDRVVLNAPLDDATFGNPAAPRRHSAPPSYAPGPSALSASTTGARGARSP
jgi:hypothetical protein